MLRYLSADIICPRSEQFSESAAREKLWASMNRSKDKFPSIRPKGRLLWIVYSLRIFNLAWLNSWVSEEKCSGSLWNKQEKQKLYKDLKKKWQGCGYETQGLILRLISGFQALSIRTYVVRTGHKTRYVHTDHMTRAHDNLPDDISEISAWKRGYCCISSSCK